MAKEAEKSMAINRKDDDEEEIERAAEDCRREAALASNPCLRPNFKPNGSITKQQISKFQELRRKRLQIKSKLKSHKKSRGGKSHSKDYNARDSEDTPVESSTDANLNSPSNQSISFIRSDKVAAEPAHKKRQKLHWGLDTRERWERKANM